MKPPKYIIFDCDGVLIDSEILASRVEAEIKAELGFPISLEDQILKFTGLGLSHPVMVEELRHLPPNFCQLVDDRIGPVYRDELRVIPGTVEFLETLKLPKSVASSSEPDWLDFKLSLTGIKKYFGSAIFHGKLVTKCKPEPDLFMFALKQLGWKAQECLVIEDSIHGVKAGVAAEMTVCGFLGGAHIRPGHAGRLTEAGAHFLISDLRELRL